MTHALARLATRVAMIRHAIPGPRPQRPPAAAALTLAAALLLTLLAPAASAMMHPQMGRFLQRDPLRYVDGMSVYANYSVMHFGLDPSGLQTKDALPFPRLPDDGPVLPDSPGLTPRHPSTCWYNYWRCRRENPQDKTGRCGKAYRDCMTTPLPPLLSAGPCPEGSYPYKVISRQLHINSPLVSPGFDGPSDDPLDPVNPGWTPGGRLTIELAPPTRDEIINNGVPTDSPFNFVGFECLCDPDLKLIGSIVERIEGTASPFNNFVVRKYLYVNFGGGGT